MEKIRGVTSATINGRVYWYARIDGKRKSLEVVKRAENSLYKLAKNSMLNNMKTGN